MKLKIKFLANSELNKKFHEQLKAYKMQEKEVLSVDRISFNKPGPMQISRGQATGRNLDARHQMEKFQPEEISQKAANILSMHVAQSPQTQELIEILNLILRKGQLYEQLATKPNGEWDTEYIGSIQDPSDFAITMANQNLPKIQTTGALLEYIVGVKRNEAAKADDSSRPSKTAWESVFVGPEQLEYMYNVDNLIREFQYDRLYHSYSRIFNSMSKF